MAGQRSIVSPGDGRCNGNARQMCLLMNHLWRSSYRVAGAICVPVRPAAWIRCCASSAAARDANGPATTCCQPSDSRRRTGTPRTGTCSATDVARASVRNDATTMSNRMSAAGGAGADVAAPAAGARRIGAGGWRGGLRAGSLRRGEGAPGVTAAGGGTSAAGASIRRYPNRPAAPTTPTRSASTRYFVRGVAAGSAGSRSAAIWSACSNSSDITLGIARASLRRQFGHDLGHRGRRL